MADDKTKDYAKQIVQDPVTKPDEVPNEGTEYVKTNDKTKNDKTNVEIRENTVMHLDRDPNDPRRNVPATPNLSDLNKEDPEKKPQPLQNPVE